jgi:drug/metabolite transporter (DMT)-like permease
VLSPVCGWSKSHPPAPQTRLISSVMSSKKLNSSTCELELQFQHTFTGKAHYSATLVSLAGSNAESYSRNKRTSRSNRCGDNVLHTDEKDYLDYMKHLSNLISVMSLFSGFMFTAYTILITRLPDPTNITAQLALYVLSTFLGIFLFILGFFATMALYSCRNLPPTTKRTAIVNLLFARARSFGTSHILRLFKSLHGQYSLWQSVYT